MKKLLAASLIALTSVTAAKASNTVIYDAYMGMDLGLGMMSYIDLSSEELKYTPNSSLLLGFELGAKFRPVDSIWNPGLSLAWNMSFPTEPEKWGYTKQKPSFSWYTYGADFDNYFAIANRTDAASRTDLILGIGYHAVTTSQTGGGFDGSTTDMSIDLKFGIDQALSEGIKLNAKMQFFLLPGEHKGDQDVFTKISIGFKALF